MVLSADEPGGMHLARHLLVRDVEVALLVAGAIRVERVEGFLGQVEVLVSGLVDHVDGDLGLVALVRDLDAVPAVEIGAQTTVGHDEVARLELHLALRLRWLDVVKAAEGGGRGERGRDVAGNEGDGEGDLGEHLEGGLKLELGKEN